jgi:cold shock CspA family protein
VFFHRSAVEGVAFEQLREGLAVSFEEVASEKGPRAARVRVE